MSNIVIRKRRGTTSGMATLIALPGEVFIDLNKSTLVVHDGTTAGGIPLAVESHGHANATESTPGFMSIDDKIKIDELTVGGGIQTIESDTTPVTPRTIINFNTDFTVIDNSGETRTDVSISQTFRDEINSNAIALIVALG